MYKINEVYQEIDIFSRPNHIKTDCEFTNKKFGDDGKLWITSDILTNDEEYFSLICSDKVFDSAKICFVENEWLDYRNWKYFRMHEIACKFGKGVKILEICHIYVTIENLRNIINYFPDIEQLELQHIRTDCFLHMSYSGHDSHDLNLPRLKKIIVNNVDEKVYEAIVCHPSNTIRKHETDGPVWEHLFENHEKLTSLTFNCVGKNSKPSRVQTWPYRAPSLIFTCKLEKFTLNGNFPHSLSDFFKFQKNLEYLDMMAITGLNEEIFREVCSLKKLKVLKIDIRKLHFSELKLLSDLDNLEDLTLYYYSNHYPQSEDDNRIKAFHVLKGNRVVKLRVLFDHKLEIPERGFVFMSINFPILKELILHLVNLSKIGVVLQNLKDIEILVFRTFGTSLLQKIDASKVYHVKLKELYICEMHSNSDHGLEGKNFNKVLRLISGCIPNLEKLCLSELTFVDFHSLLKILNECQSLTHLYISRPRCSSEYRKGNLKRAQANEIKFDEKFVNILRKFHQKLKYFKCWGLKIDIDEESFLKAFENQFEIEINLELDIISLKTCEWSEAEKYSNILC